MEIESLLITVTSNAQLPAKAAKALTENGLSLGTEELRELHLRKSETLKELDRFETDNRLTGELIERFADSPFMDRDKCCDQFCEVIELFLELRDEVPSFVGDEELMIALRAQFDTMEGETTAICISDLREGILADDDSTDFGKYRIVDDEGREYVFNVDDRSCECAFSAGDGGREYAFNAGDEGRFSSASDEGRKYVSSADGWEYDEHAPGWDGERWEDD